MNRENSIESEVDQTMASMDKLQRATGNPWLFTRIQAKMQAENKQVTFLLSPKVQWMGFCLLLLLNGFALFAYTHKKTYNNEEYLVQAVSEQFGFQSPTNTGLYLFEN